MIGRPLNAAHSIKERLERYVIPEPNSGCLLWMRGVDRQGYGRIWINNKHVGVHRVAYELARGPIPAGLYVCHKCDVPSCLNPDHLWLGTNDDNMADKKAKGRAVASPRAKAQMSAARRRYLEATQHLRVADVEIYRIALSKPGASYRSVAKQLGVSKSKLHRLFRRGTADLSPAQPDDLANESCGGVVLESPESDVECTPACVLPGAEDLAWGAQAAKGIVPGEPTRPLKEFIAEQRGPYDPAPGTSIIPNVPDDLAFPPFLDRRGRA